jgi:hypothetical protein
VTFWYQYRDAWSQRPWVLLLGLFAVLVLVAGILGTIAVNGLALLFIPGLAGIYVHHLIVKRLTD